MGLDTPHIEDRKPIAGVSGASEFVIPNQPGRSEELRIGTGVDFPVIFLNDALHHPDRVGPHYDDIFNVNKWRSEVLYTNRSNSFRIGISLIPGIYVGKGHMPFETSDTGESYRSIHYPGRVGELVKKRSEDGETVVDLSSVRSPLALIVEPIGEGAMDFPENVDVIVTLYKRALNGTPDELLPTNRYRGHIRNGVKGENYVHVPGEYTEFEELPLEPSQKGTGKKGPLLVPADKDSVLTLVARFAQSK